MNNTFILFYSPKPWSQVCILIYRKWSTSDPSHRLSSGTSIRVTFVAI